MASSPSALAGLPASCLPITAESLNRGCACRSLDPERLRYELGLDRGLDGLAGDILHDRSHLFAPLAVFISPAQLERMQAIVAAVEEVLALPGYRNQALTRAPAIAARDFGPRGAMTGLDFHMTTEGPRLIEINTNAGGALLNAALLRAQHACCSEVFDVTVEPIAGSQTPEKVFYAEFMSEWRSQRKDQELGRVAIVDDECETQYLYPEFLLFKRFFTRFGHPAVVANAGELEWRDGRLWHRGLVVDMVYNRLTDFYLQDPTHQALREAYESGAVVLTPGPHAHALYADKRNLMVLSDDAALQALGASSAVRRVLSKGVPPTERVTPEKAEDLWARRRSLFFKPAAGYGSKAAYRGDKLTRRVWGEILKADYVAQALTPPSERVTEVDGVETDLKLDVRAYVYAGRIQLLAARLYQGQTTNFRTEGGGFAPVFLVR